MLLAALLFGGMRAGAPSMQIQAEIPVEIVDVLQAIILLFLVVNVLAPLAGSAGSAARTASASDDLTMTSTPAFGAVAK